MPGRARARAHAFVEDLDAPCLDDDDRHHLERVLRIGAGDLITVSDGLGGRRSCRFGDALEPVGDISVDRAPEQAVAVAFAVVKGDRPEWAVQKLTELGVDRIVPFLADRSVVRWTGDRADRHIERLRRVARSAAMQSRRTWLPEIEPVRSFTTVASRPGAVLADRDGGGLGVDVPLVLIGPEGGWSDVERAAPIPHIRLGDTTLRAETAAVSAAVLLTAIRPGGALNA